VDASSPIDAFEATRWRLGALGRRSNQASTSLNFELYPQRFRDVAKRVAWLLINNPKPTEVLNRRGAKPRSSSSQQSIRNVSAELLRFFRWLPESAEDLSEVDARTLEEFLDHAITLAHPDGTAFSYETRKRTLASVELLHYLSRDLPARDHLIRPPWLDERVVIKADKALGNQTDAMPSEVYGPLLAWAELFVDVLGPDILEARKAKERLDALPAAAGFVSLARVKRVVDEWMEAHDYLPARADRVTPMIGTQYLFRVAGEGVGKQTSMADRLRKLGYGQVPLVPDCPLDSPINGMIEGKPWVSALDYYTLSLWTKALVEACMIIIAFGTALRGEELLSLSVDSEGRSPVERVESPSGQVQWLVHGRLFKGQRDLSGKQRLDGIPVTWATIEIGARAIAILVEVTDSEWLFATRKDNAVKTNVANVRLKEFVAKVRQLTTDLCLSDAYMLPPETEMYLRSRVFRRTTMVMIQQQVGGLLAAGWQAKHLVGDVWETDVTSGYGDKSRTRKLVEDARAEQTVAALEELATRAAHGQAISGPAVREAQALLNSLDPDGDLMRLVENREFDRLARTAAQSVYLVSRNGATNFCIHDVTKAACSKGDAPDIANCQLICPNKAYTDDDLGHMRERILTLRGEARLLPKPAADRCLRTADTYEAELARAVESRVFVGMPDVRRGDV
jgi:hypothetical protein